MSDIPLSKIVIAGLIGTFVIATLFNMYSGYIYLNHGTIQEPYKSAFEKIAGNYSEFSDIATTASDQSLVKNILDFGKNAITGTVNVFVVGLDAIGSLFGIIPVIGNLISAIKVAVPQLAPILGLFTVIVGFYVAMRYIKSVSNKQELP